VTHDHAPNLFWTVETPLQRQNKQDAIHIIAPFLPNGFHGKTRIRDWTTKGAKGHEKTRKDTKWLSAFIRLIRG
jgi:hypothetical protein